MEGQSIHIQNCEPKHLAKLKRLKCHPRDLQDVGMKNLDASLFGINYIWLE